MPYEKLKTPLNVLLIGLFLTILVAFESLYFVPWAPYFIIYAILAIILPLIVGSYKFGNLITILKNHIRIFLTLIILSIALLYLIDLIYVNSLRALGLFGNPYYDLSAALDLLAETAAVKFGIDADTAKLIYALYILLWAPIGEELFYRGYMYGELKKKTNIIPATLISTFFFGIRHSTHFLFLLPDFPLVAALYWALHAFIFGIIMVYAYEKTDSLYIPMLIHFLFNLIQALLPT